MVFSKWGSNQTSPFLFYMKITCVLIFLNLSFLCFSQDTTNLVPNWSFESKDSCPNIYLPVEIVTEWENGNTSSPDYFNLCNDTLSDIPRNFVGYQFAKNGAAYVGICTNINGEEREYITIELSKKIENSRTYCFELFYSLAEISVFHTPSIQAYFSTDSVYQNNIYRINISPQITNNNPITNDTTNWQIMTGSFVSQGNENYLTIGNFMHDSLSNLQLTGFGTVGGAYYYIDAVRLYDCTQPDTTVYTIEIFPNPNNGIFSLNYNLGEKPSGSFRIYDAIGKLINDEDLTQNNGTLNLNLLLSDGVYLWEVKDSDGNLLKGDKIVVVK